MCVRAHELHLNHIVDKQRNGVHRPSGPVSNHVQSNCKVVLFLRRELGTSKYNCCIFITEEVNCLFYRVLFPIHVTQRFRHVVFVLESYLPVHANMQKLLRDTDLHQQNTRVLSRSYPCELITLQAFHTFHIS